jgi:hypothetical protein
LLRHGTISAGRKKGQARLHGTTDYDQEHTNTSMRTLTTSNNLVRLNFLAALLRDAGIDAILLDNHVSAVEGSIGAIPRRLAVLEEDEAQARRVLREAGES